NTRSSMTPSRASEGVTRGHREPPTRRSAPLRGLAGPHTVRAGGRSSVQTNRRALSLSSSGERPYEPELVTSVTRAAGRSGSAPAMQAPGPAAPSQDARAGALRSVLSAGAGQSRARAAPGSERGARSGSLVPA